MKLKEVLFSALTVVVGFVVTAHAATELANGVTWTYTVSDGRATVGDGSTAAISTATAKAVVVPDTLGVAAVVLYPDGRAIAQIDFKDGISIIAEGSAVGTGECWLFTDDDGAVYAIIVK